MDRQKKFQTSMEALLARTNSVKLRSQLIDLKILQQNNLHILQEASHIIEVYSSKEGNNFLEKFEMKKAKSINKMAKQNQFILGTLIEKTLIELGQKVEETKEKPSKDSDETVLPKPPENAAPSKS